MPKLDRSLAIGRANYQRWLGTEPEEIAAAAEVLRRFAPEHPCLLELEVRLCRARQIKRCSPRFFSRSGWRRTTRSGGGCDGEPRRSLRRGIVAATVPCSGRALLRSLLALPCLPKSQRLGQLRPSLRVVRRDHRVIERQRPLLPILRRSEAPRREVAL
jgi:hypothetical protein